MRIEKIKHDLGYKGYAFVFKNWRFFFAYFNWLTLWLFYKILKIKFDILVVDEGRDFSRLIDLLIKMRAE
jgi:hypothetical protein